MNEFLPQEEVLRRMVVSDFQVPWNKLYRRKLLENLRYPENKAFEDTCLMPVIYARAASACGVWDFLYNYRIVTGSAMHRKTTLKTLDWVEAWYRLFDVLYPKRHPGCFVCSLSPDFDCRVGHLAAPDTGRAQKPPDEGSLCV